MGKSKPILGKHAIGIDFGGTSIKMALVAEQGRIHSRTTIATKDAKSRTAWLDAVERGLKKLEVKGGRGSEGFAGIGVGVPGFVDFDRGYIYDLPNVPGWDGIHLATNLEERFGVRAFVDNDVNAMALGECTFGSGRLYEHAVFVTLGTGVGGALLIHNKLYRGAYSMAGELGHMSIDMNGRKTEQGRGGLETYVGNRRIVERAVRILKKKPSSRIHDLVDGDLSQVTPRILAEAAGQGDEVGEEIFDFVADCLATAFAAVTYLLQPQIFIVGGGVAQSGEVLFDPLRRHLDERLSRHFAKRVEVRPARLGNDAGVIGSATLALLS